MRGDLKNTHLISFFQLKLMCLHVLGHTSLQTDLSIIGGEISSNVIFKTNGQVQYHFLQTDEGDFI